MNLEALKRIAVLQTMDEEALGGLAAVLEPRDFADGQTIFREGDPADGMYFLAAGAVRVEKQTGPSGAWAKTLAVLEPGDYFGEMALFDRQPRSAAAVAVGATQTFRLSAEAFGALHGSGGRAGLGVLFAMIRTSSDRIRRLSTHVVVYDEVGKAIGEAPTLNDLLDVVLRQLAGAIQADWGMVLVRAQFADRLELRGALNLTLTAAQEQDIAAGKGFLALAVQEAREQLVRDGGVDEPFKSCPRLGFEMPSLLLAPILVGNQALGWLVFGGQEPGQFVATHLQLVRGVARQAAQAILSARHREEEQARARHGRQFVRF